MITTGFAAPLLDIVKVWSEGWGTVWTENKDELKKRVH